VRFAAILSDLDGVLVDSGEAVEGVWRDWAAAQGLDADAVARASHGVPSREVIAAVAPQLDAAAEAERVDALHAATGGRPLPGAAELLAAAPSESLAVVTSCGSALAAARLRSAGLPEPAILVTVDAVRRGKPAPDAYLVAAQALGAEPGECVVIEDAPAGVRAGRAAGMTVWAVTTTHTEDELEDADRTADDLAALLEPLGLEGPAGR
jgi:mannitol-1-/sugar-/sorbitol-6-phosphatase